MTDRPRRFPAWVRPAVWAVGIVAAVIVAFSVIAVVHAFRIEHRLSSIPGLIQQAETEAGSGQLGRADQALVRAQALLTSANSALYNSIDFAVVGRIPIEKQNLDALKRATGLGLQMIGGGEQILSAASPLKASDGHLEVPMRNGVVPLSTTEAIQAAILNVVSALPTSGHTPDGSFVLGPVHRAEQRVFAEALKRRAEFQSVGAAIRLVDDIAGASGDQRYLIAVGNTAEMRGSGGMILSYGVLTSHAGKIKLAHFGGIDELKLSAPETAVRFPPDFATTYAGLAPAQNWRNANMMSDFTVDAPVLEAMYRKATGQRVDGVIQVDPEGLSALLAGIGPVGTTDLGTATAANVVALTLNRAYFLFPGRQVRQDYTGEVARAAFARLVSGDFPALRPLGAAIVRAGQERHVILYADDPTDETAARALGLTGDLPPSESSFAQLTVQNFGGNKLDYYLRSAVTLRGSRLSTTGSHLTATIYLANDAPPGQSQPVELFGPFNPGGTPGEYQGMVTLYLPVGSYLQSSQTDATATADPVQGTQNGITAITFTVAIPAGGRSTTVLQIYVPPTPSRTRTFEVVPTPRVNPTTYSEKFA